MSKEEIDEILQRYFPDDYYQEQREKTIPLLSKAICTFADQQVREYEENLAKKNSLDQFLEVNQKLVFTQCEKAVTEYRDKLKMEAKAIAIKSEPDHRRTFYQYVKLHELNNLIDSE